MEDLKSIKIALSTPDELGKISLKEVSIKLSKPKQIIEQRGYGSADLYKYSILFSFVIPEYIHSALIGKSIGHSYKNKDGQRKYDNDFAKSISAPSLEALTDRWLIIVNDFAWLKKIEKLELKKCIYYLFESNSTAFNSSWNGTKFGTTQNMGFTYAIGYIAFDKDNELRYNSLKQMSNSSYDRDFHDMNYVLWTREREEYFDSIQQSFDSTIHKMSQFDESLSEQSIDNLMISGQKLIG